MVNRERNKLRAVLRQRFPRNHGQLLPALHYLQHEFGYLPEWAMEVVGWHLGIPASEVYGAATSYTELRLQKPGDNIIRVCAGLSCWLNGGGELLSAMQTALGVHSGETAPDGGATLEETACAFMCAVAPVMELNGKWHGRLTPESANALVQGEATQ